MPFFHRDNKDSNNPDSKSARRARSLSSFKGSKSSSPRIEDNHIPGVPSIPHQHATSTGAVTTQRAISKDSAEEKQAAAAEHLRLISPQPQSPLTVEFARTNSPSIMTTTSNRSASRLRAHVASDSISEEDSQYLEQSRPYNGEQQHQTRSTNSPGGSDREVPAILAKNRPLIASDMSTSAIGPKSSNGRLFTRPIVPDLDRGEDNSTRHVVLSPSRSQYHLGKLSISTNNSGSNYDEVSYGRPSHDIRESIRESAPSFVTGHSSAPSTPPLDRKGEPYMPNDEFHSYDLLPPAKSSSTYSLEESSVKLFSGSHLEVMFASPTLLNRFVKFVATHRPAASMQLLIYYFDALKALKAIKYANAVQESLEPIAGLMFTEEDPNFPLKPTFNRVLETRAADAFRVLVEQELPRYITWVYVEIITHNIAKKVMGQLPSRLKDSIDALAEVFCLTDPSRPDNPIIFASEEFHRTTQYGVDYVVNRNCRFLQGPKTDRHSTARLRDAIKAGREVSEVFLNYRRDGSPFMNLLMCAPLCDSRGNVRYFLGAQVDVSQLVKDGMGLESFRRLEAKEIKGDVLEIEKLSLHSSKLSQQRSADLQEFTELAELFGPDEVDIVRTSGGRMHREREANEVQTGVGGNTRSNASVLNHGMAPKPRVVIKSGTPPPEDSDTRGPSPYWNASLRGVYKNYLLVRPYPSLRILFSSPSLRTPGILQSPFLSKIGGSQRMRDELENALMDGRGLTAKVRWLSRRDDRDVMSAGRERWIHATPLLAENGAVGVWMIVLLDEDKLKLVDPDPSGFRSPTSIIEKSKYRDAPVIGHPEEWRNRSGDDMRGYERSAANRSRAGVYSDHGSESVRSMASREDLTL